MTNRSESYVVVGRLQQTIIALLNLALPPNYILMSVGVKKHIKKKHKNCLKYLPGIADIIADPDYVGVNPNEPNSLEYVKILDDNILVSVNLSKDANEQYLFVSSMYEITDGKLNNRVNSGRLKKIV